MKKTIIVIALASIFLSCSNSSTKSTDNADSLNTDNADSLKTSTIDTAAAKIAYGSMNFGISEKEFKKTLPNTLNKIGSYEYAFYPRFSNDDKLYLLEIATVSKPATEIESYLEPFAENLVKVLTNKYGLPTESRAKLDFFDFKPGTIQWQHYWKIHTKTLKIGISENYTGGTYRTLLWIYDEPAFEKIKNENLVSDESQRLKDSEKF